MPGFEKEEIQSDKTGARAPISEFLPHTKHAVCKNKPFGLPGAPGRAKAKRHPLQ